MQRNTSASKPARYTSRPVERISTRIVNEGHWVHRNQLEIGMYVSELDRPWTETHFMFQGFRIDNHDVLEQVREACEYARVHQEKLAMVSSNSSHRLVGGTRRSS